MPSTNPAVPGRSVYHCTLAAALALLTLSIVAVRAHPASPRVERLLSAMTLEEKIGQLNLASRGDTTAEQVARVAKGEIGIMLNVVHPDEIAAFKAAARRSRLGIPVLMGLDAIHVFRVAMPVPLAWAATWRPELAERATNAVAREAASVGLQWTFAPMVDLSRDPRWGRVIEGAGEDPFLAAAFAAARVRGYRSGGLATSVKHFVGYGAPEAGRDYNGASMGRAELHDRYLPPFRAALDAGSETVMSAFNTVNGVPVTADRRLLTDLLRGRWGFKGFVTSDFNAIGELRNHGVAASLDDAAVKAIRAGVDVDMEGAAYERHLADAVRSGRLPQAVVDDAVRRVLHVKEQLGLFERDHPPPPAPAEADVRKTARDVAQESFVLLKNNAAVLPLDTRYKRIALVGAWAEYDYDMSWYGPAGSTKPETETLRAALERRRHPGQRIDYVPAFADPCGREPADQNAAVAAARAADVVLLIVAEDCDIYGEAASRTYLGLSGPQQSTLDALAATGKPVALVVTTGRPLTLSAAAPRAHAILIAWHPGTEGRTALAETLLGHTAPSGRLPMTFPRSIGQIPLGYDALPTSRPTSADRFTSRYVDEEAEPLFPFGHGLTYTTIDYKDVTVKSARLRSTGTIEAEVTLHNAGKRAGVETVQLYTRQLVASRSRPLRQLKAFRKIEIAPGATEVVRLTIPVSDLGFHDDDGVYRVEPGPFLLYAGPSAETHLSTAFEVIAD